MSKPGQYFLTGLLAIVLAMAPLRAVMALSMSFDDQGISMADHGSELQQTGQATTDPDSDHCEQAHERSCCDDTDSSTCATDCHACTSLSFAITSTPSVKTALQYFTGSGFIDNAVPLRDLAPLLRPPVRLHS